MGLRRKSRELALQFLFSHDFQQMERSPEILDRELEKFNNNFSADRNAIAYSRHLINGIVEKQAEIDTLIGNSSHNWRVERMSLVDRNILRIAVYEMRYGVDVPTRVAINEALEIAKRFSIPDSVAFINGILDALQQENNKRVAEPQ